MLLGHSTKWTNIQNLNIIYSIKCNIVLIANVLKFMDLKTKLQLKLLQKRYRMNSRHQLFCQINAIITSYVKHQYIHYILCK